MIRSPIQEPVARRRLVASGVGLLGGASLGWRPVAAQDGLFVASGSGVNLKMMPDQDGELTVPLRELFGFDSSYAQCVIEDNADVFAMDTLEMGRVGGEPHTFFMAMYAHEISLV